jgi:hypothetical protein
MITRLYEANIVIPDEVNAGKEDSKRLGGLWKGAMLHHHHAVNLFSAKQSGLISHVYINS